MIPTTTTTHMDHHPTVHMGTTLILPIHAPAMGTGVLIISMTASLLDGVLGSAGDLDRPSVSSSALSMSSGALADSVAIASAISADQAECGIFAAATISAVAR